MRIRGWMIAVLLGAPGVQAQGPVLPQGQSTAVLIEADRGRESGIFAKSPVVQRAILVKPQRPTDTALLVFRGNPGYALIESLADRHKNLPGFIRLNQGLFLQAGIALVVMDCPTDQWGASGGPGPTSCFDDYRSSQQHADDVRSITAKLRGEHGLTRHFIIGHSMGSVSSRWLAKNLGPELAGSIHLASVNVANPRGYGRSMEGFPYGEIAAPVLHVHNARDACRGTPYERVRAYAGDRLMTVRGGVAEGDPCGGGHLHSYQGIEAVVARGIIDWIRTGRVEPVIGE